MINRIFVWSLILLCAISIYAQTRRKKSPVVPQSQSGYYFTINTCNACCYDWHKSAANFFKASGIPAVIVSGQERTGSDTQGFAPIRSFEKFFYEDVTRDSEICAQITLYIGPFGSENAAVNALEKFPAVLVDVIKNRGSDDIYTEAQIRSFEQSKITQQGTSNNWIFGDDSFFFINGYQIVQPNTHKKSPAKADQSESGEFVIVPTGENAPEAIIRVVSATMISGRYKVVVAGGPCRNQSKTRFVYIINTMEKIAKDDLFFRVFADAPFSGRALRRADSREKKQYENCQWR